MDLLQQGLTQDVDRDIWMMLEDLDEVFQQVFSLLCESVALNQHEGKSFIDDWSLFVLFLGELVEKEKQQVVTVCSQRVGLDITAACFECTDNSLSVRNITSVALDKLRQ